MVDKEEIFKKFNIYFGSRAGLTIRDDGVVDVDGSVRLARKTKKLPVQFGRVDGDFSCVSKGLETLQGSPKIVEGGFFCGGNDIKTSLQGLPAEIGGDLVLDYYPELPLLRTLATKGRIGICYLHPYVKQVSTVLNQFKGQGKAGAMACTLALLKLEKQLKEHNPEISLRENIKW